MPHAMPPMQIRANPRSIIACARKTEGALMGIWQLIQQALLGKAAERPVAAQSPAPAVQAGKTVQTGKASQAGKAVQRPQANAPRTPPSRSHSAPHNPASQPAGKPRPWHGSRMAAIRHCLRSILSAAITEPPNEATPEDLNLSRSWTPPPSRTPEARLATSKRTS